MKRRTFSVMLVGIILVIILLPLGTPSTRAEQVIYYPGQTVLGVENTVFGSRLNINRHYDWGHRKAWTSTRGTMMDDKTSFIVATRSDADGSVMRFAPSDQNYPEYWYHVMELDANTHQANGAHVRNGVMPGVASDIIFSVNEKTISHFVPTVSLQDPNIKMAIAPFFYEEVTVANWTDNWQSGELLVSVDYAVDYKQMGDTKIIYYQTGADRGGIRALAIKDSSASWGIGTRIFGDFAATGRLINQNQADGVYNAGGFAVSFNLAPHQSVKKILVYAGYDSGNAMTDQKTSRGLKLYYTKFFRNVEEVIQYAFSDYGNIVQKANNFSASLRTGDVAMDFTLSQAIHSYMAKTWLLYDPASGEPRYYVNEGDCRFLSTVDVAYETFLFELKYIPWAAKLQLDEWSSHYSADQYGVYLEHDLGVNSTVMPRQAYQDCMGVEENLNYILMSYSYWKETGDQSFVSENILNRLEKYMDSVIARDSNGNGLPDTNAYYTTFDYDAGHSAIGNAKENTYIGVKTFGASRALSEMCRVGGHIQKADRYYGNAVKVKDTLNAAYNNYGYLPVSLSADHPGWGDHTIVTFEGLIPFIVYGIEDPLIDELLVVTAPSLYYAFQHCSRTYGYSLVSSSDVSWLSKTFDAKLVSDYFIVKGFYSMGSMGDDVIPKARNLIQGSDMGWVDTWDTSNAQVLCLKLYPRGVSLAALVYRLPDIVNFGYQRWLKRSPEPSGYEAYYFSLRRGSMSVDHFTQILRHSQEYAEIANFYIGSKRCTGYVDWAFQYHFGHPQDQEGRQHFISLLTSWQWNDSQVFWEFYYANIVFEMYRELLFRNPDPGGYESNMNALKSGVSREILENNIRNSPEYRQKHPY